MSKIYASTILNIAKKELGNEEKPANSNKVKYNTWYYGEKVSGAAYPWCAAFVSWCFSKADAISLIGGKKAYCPDVENYFRKVNRWHKNTAGKAGDLCLMDFGKGRASHVGIVEKKNADGTYTVIEGNTSLSSNDNGGKVMRRTRSKSVIRGFGRPKYDKKPTTPKIIIKTKCRLYKKAMITKGSYGVLPVGKQIQFISDTKKGWSKVKAAIGGKTYTGYCKNTCIKGKSGLSTYKTVKTITNNSPLRIKNKAGSKVLARIPKGVACKRISKGKVWSNVKVTYKGKSYDGFLANKRLK